MFFILFALTSSVYGQIGAIKKKDCTEKGALRKRNVKYAEWECGKRAGTIDCNEKLSYNEDNNTFLAGIDASPYNGKCETCHNNGLI